MEFWKHILQLILQHKSGVLLYVLESKGSSPGRQGFRMMVTATGEMTGSIGGGIMEHKMVELAKSKLRTNDLSVLFKRQIHSKLVANNQSGMICSGEQSIALIPISEKEIPLLEKIIKNLEKGENCVLQISPNGIDLSEIIPKKSYEFQFKNEQNWQYIEKMGFKKFAYIIGGGHVGKALSRVLVDLEFYCTIIDDREQLHTLENNIYAHRKITADYEELEQYIPEGEDVFIFIMTFGYRTDLVALQALINKQVAFKGMMGSKKKVKELMEEMISLGYPKEQLATVHSPIGLNIKSRTPQEIAISIAAQLIQQSNKELK